MALSENSMSTYLNAVFSPIVPSSTRAETAEELAQASDLELLQIMVESDSLKARRYGNAPVEFTKRYDKKLPSKNT
jgi:hypothetical protein